VKNIRKASVIVEREANRNNVGENNQELPGTWEKKQKILVILAHPDDPEFFCGATLARWAAMEHEIVYCLLTCGDKGTNDRTIKADELCGLRVNEQRAAAAVIGARNVRFMGYADGYIIPDLELRKEVTRVIRQEKPDIIVTCDPLLVYAGETRLNHPDHRAAGQVVIDAVFPAAGNHMYFPELLEEGLEPHTPSEVWLSIPQTATVTLDVTDYWDVKIRALKEHKTQIGDPEKLAERMRERRATDSTPEQPRYEERFRRLIFR
jgi:LmbE family N-acetylglucosaminyl deacetylase